MSAREPYDHERVVRHSEIHDDPTEVIPTAEPDHPHTHAANAHYHDEVVVERPARPVYNAGAIREDVSIDHVVERRAMLDRISSIIWFAAGLLEVALGLRIVFRLLEANEASGFVRFIYGFTEPFVRPFQGIFAEPAADGAVLDSAAITAMIIYALITWAIVRLIWLMLDRPETGAHRSVSEIRRDRI
jgi:uncharacterized protein YggT (Ycf19 family)